MIRKIRTALMVVCGAAVLLLSVEGCSSSSVVGSGSAAASTSPAIAEKSTPEVVTVNGITVAATPELCAWIKGKAGWSTAIGQSFHPVSQGAGAGDARGGKLMIAVNAGQAAPLLSACGQ